MRGLLASADRAALTDYLRTLQSGADLDALLVCSVTGIPLAQVGDSLPPDACQAPRDGWLALSADGDQTLWLLDTQPVEGLPDATPPQVIVGIRLSPAFAAQLHAQTGLEHTLLVACLLYTSDAADERSSVDLGGRRIIKIKNTNVFS